VNIISETILKLINLSKSFGKLKAVDKINLEVQKGEVIGLVGPNGAGKTTTIKMIANILKPDEGEILIKNQKGNLQNLVKNSRHLIPQGFLIDIPSFYKMTAYDLLKYFAKLTDYPRNKIDDRIDELLKLFNLYQWKYTRVDKFSKGMNQKLGIIQAIIHDPEIIILDEPQMGLDPKARLELRRFLKILNSRGKTIFLASHLLHEISEICNKIALINLGKIIKFDTIENLGVNLRTNEVIVNILNDIEEGALPELLNNMIQKLKPYLIKSVNLDITEQPINYSPLTKEFRIYYNGKKESKAEILKILLEEFDSDFTVTSFSQPRTHQLERIYEELIQKEPRRSQLEGGTGI